MPKVGYLVIDAETGKPLRFSRFSDPFLALAFGYRNCVNDFRILDMNNKPIPASRIRSKAV